MLNLGKTTFLYAVGTFLRYSTTLILVPIYTASLAPAEYGTVETLTVIQQTLLILFGLGLSNALIRFYSECENEEETLVLMRTSTFLVVLSSVVMFLILSPFLETIGQGLFKQQGQALLLILTSIWAIGVALNEHLFAYFRARQDARSFVLLSLALFVMLVVLNLVFVRVLNLRVWGILLGNVVAVSVLNGLLGFRLLKSGLSISRRWSRIILIFSLPLVLSRFGWLILNSADRYFLAYSRDLGEVGTYGLGYKIGLIAQIAVIVPFQLAWGPFLFTRASEADGNAGEDFSRVLTYLILAFCSVSLFLLFFSEELAQFLGSGKFPEARAVVPFVLVAYLFNAIYFWAGNLFHLARRTSQLSIIIIAMAVLNLLLNWLLVPNWGWIGAGIATVVSVGGAGLLTLVFSRGYYQIPLQKARIAKVLLSTFMVVGIYLLIPTANHGLWTLLRFGLLAIFFSLLWTMRFFSSEETRYLLGLPGLAIQKIGLSLARLAR